jgi:hypothetical protein
VAQPACSVRICGRHVVCYQNVHGVYPPYR